MKIRTGFVSNSSSSSFLVKTDSKYFQYIKQNEPDFHYKRAHDVGRCTGIYRGEDILDFIKELRKWTKLNWFKNISSLVKKYKPENVALVMISDEEMGGCLPEPDDKSEILFEMEYH
jgi:hypothetical protein